ncbi:MAG TPA: hypothetical protein VMW11_04320 [Candidatus Dormibacteraeota bacterium]|nr:hypothetical protein [Candidatus Dormibacteraeota bacterium]
MTPISPPSSWTSRLRESWRTCHTPGEYLGLIVGVVFYIVPALVTGAFKGIVEGLRRPIRNGRR